MLFLTWHRPYLALVEVSLPHEDALSLGSANRTSQQLIAGHAQQIAQGYNSSSYQAAANNLRIPYWDWASVPAMPDVVSEQYVQITTPSGVKTVANPLFQ